MPYKAATTEERGATEGEIYVNKLNEALGVNGEPSGVELEEVSQVK